MKQFLISLLFLPVFSFAVEAPLPVEQCKNQVPFGQPKSARSDTTLICRTGYFLEHDNKAKIPAWVSYVLTPAHAVGCFPRTGRFVPEPGLRADATATAKDYAKSGYDIGHMANDSDMRWSEKTETESAIFANAAPQLPGLNRAGWLELEAKTRTWVVSRQHPIVIYVGPIYDTKAPTTIGPGRVTVPTAFYKVLVDLRTRDVLAFIYPQAETREAPGAFLTSLAEVQRQIGFVLPMPKRAKFSTAVWPSTTTARKQKATACSIE